MAYTITQTCCQDASCIAVCPVNCIHPAPGEPDFGRTDSLYIDPRSCIDCGACADECPVDAVVPDDTLADHQLAYADQAAAYYRGRTAEPAWGLPEIPPTLPAGAAPLRIAVVGSGPAACYAAQELLLSTGAEVTMLERLPVPGGLLRYGVAPDHPDTKKMGERYDNLFRHPRLRMFLNVEVGTHLTHEDLAAHHHAVIYAVGAPAARPLGIPGEELPGSVPAASFVAWYNGHPDAPADTVDLRGVRRAVVVGNGNVALDIARVLACDPERFAGTDIADHALSALRAGDVGAGGEAARGRTGGRGAAREVVLLGRRGPLEAAFSWPELHALTRLPDVNLVLADDPRVRAALGSAAPTDPDRAAVVELLRGLPSASAAAGGDASADGGGERRIVLRFFTAPGELVGGEGVSGVRVSGVRVAGGECGVCGVCGEEGGDGGSAEVIAAELVVAAVGYRGTPIAGLPFDERAGTVPNERGRILDPATGRRAGAYAVGWIKRGPSGGIGANRQCARETVEALVEDAAAGLVGGRVGTAKEFERLVRRRRPGAITGREAAAIDRAEQASGRAVGRPRVKLVTVDELLAAGRRGGR